MRIFLLLLFYTIYFNSCHTQDWEGNRINVNLDISKLQNKAAQLGKGRFLAVNDDLVIAQIGIVDVFLIDLKSGQVIKSIDTSIIVDSLEKCIHRLLGEQYYVPNKEENLRSKYQGVLPYDIHGLLYLKEKTKFAINMVTTIFNRNDEQEQKLFPSLILFDKNLNNIEIIPFDPYNRSTNSAWANGGFFLWQDRMFTKMLAWKHDHNFDFLEYNLDENHTYTLTDTLFGVKTDTLGYVGRFYNCFSINDKNYLNLGSMLYSYEGGKIYDGHVLQFPKKDERYFMYIEPIDEQTLVAYATNNYRTEPDPTGWLLLLDNNFTIIKIITQFDLRKYVFCSLFTSGNSVYIANYDENSESYFLLKYMDF
jgi:hypothetical protein